MMATLANGVVKGALARLRACAAVVEHVTALTSSMIAARYAVDESDSGITDAQEHASIDAALREAFGGGATPPAARARPRAPAGAGAAVPAGEAARGRQVINGIIATNLAVFGAFQIPRLQPTMMIWFTCGADAMRDGTRGAVRMLTCTYAHAGMIHLGANMLTLYSFAPRIVSGRNSPATPRLSPGEFFALWTVAGALSSLASSLFYARIGSYTPSLGASGSLFAVLTYFCLSHPDAGLLVFFVLPVAATTGLTIATAANLMLVARAVAAARARASTPMIDGMAHLGGTAVGAAWFAKRSGEESRRQRGAGSAGGGGGRAAGRGWLPSSGGGGSGVAL